MAVDMLEDMTDKKTAAYYPVQWQSRIYALICLLVLLVIVIAVTSVIGSTHI